MFKFSRYLLLLLLFVAFGHVLHAQIIQDPASWKYEVRKKGHNTYDLVFKLVMKKGWHVWSLTPGGDGMQVPPSFTFDGVQGVRLIGNVKEKGMVKSTQVFDGVEGALTYFEGSVEYVQTITAKPNTVIKGKHKYQMCNNDLCLAPKKKNFSFALK